MYYCEKKASKTEGLNKIQSQNIIKMSRFQSKMIHSPSPQKTNSSYQEQERSQFKGQSIGVDKMIDTRII